MNPKKRPSMQDIIRQRQQEAFVGREDQLDYFREQLSLSGDDRRRRFVLNVFGQGGVGKTTILKEFKRVASEASAIAAQSDDDEPDVPAAMARLVEQFEAQGYECREFTERYKAYRQKRDEVEASPDAPQGLTGLFARAATKVGAKVLRNTVPGSDLVLDFVEDPLAEQVSQWAEFVRKKLGNKDEVRLVLDPEKVLTPLFVKGLEALSLDHRAVVMFDTYESTSTFLDSWLYDLLKGRHGELPADLTIVVAGRQELDRNTWSDVEGVIARLSLEPFNDEEAQDYLIRKEITHDKVIKVIISLSGRLPLLLAILAKESPDDPDKVGDATGTAVERFLKWVDDPARRALALDGALPRRLNRDIVALLGGEAADFEWLRDNPFVERRASTEGWTYHQVVRAQMLRYKREESPTDWTAIHEKLAEHYRLSRDNLELAWREGAKDPHWRDAALEHLYHRLCAHPDKELASVLNDFVSALDVRRALANEWAITMELAGRDTSHDSLLAWGIRLREGLQAYENANYEVAAGMFARLAGVNKIEAAKQPIVFAWRGETCRLMERYDDALADFDRAIELNSKYTWAITGRASTYGLMERYDDALADFDRAIELDPENAWAITSRASTYERMERYDDALADFDRAINLNPKYTWAIASRARTYRLMERYDDALADFDRAIELNPKYTWAIISRAITYERMERYDDPLADFDRVIELNSEDAYAITSRGQVYQTMERYNDALTDFDRAIELNPEDAYAITSRGQVYQTMERYNDALTDFDRAIELNPKYTWAISSRARAYRLMKRYDDALADFDRVIELDKDDAWDIAHRGQVYRALNRYDEALADFDRAIELKPNYTWAISSRARTYEHMKRYNEALADFDRTIELDKDDAWDIAHRGQVYRALNRYDEALADFDRAIELDAANLYTKFLRWLVLNAIGNVLAARLELSKATEQAEKLLIEKPDEWYYLFNLALFRVAQGDSNGAERLYKDALSRRPSSSILESVLEAQNAYLAANPRDEVMVQMRDLVIDAINRERP